MIIEFVGMPGVGKTTIAREVAALLRTRGIPVRSVSRVADGRSIFQRRLRTTVVFIHFFIKNPFYVFRIYNTIRATRQVNLREHVTLTLNWALCAAETEEKHSQWEIQILDQGVFQMVWSIALRGRAPESMALAQELLNSVRLPDVVAIVNAPLDVVKQRLMTRKGKESRLETLLPKEPWQLIRSHSLMKEVEKQISALSRQNQMKVVPIDNSRPGMPRDALRRLVEEVVQLYNAFAP